MLRAYPIGPRQAPARCGGAAPGFVGVDDAPIIVELLTGSLAHQGGRTDGAQTFAAQCRMDSASAPPARDAMTGAAQPPLVDMARVASLSFFTPEKLQGLFIQVLAAAEGVAAGTDAASFATAAHTLKGSAGTVGLARIAAIASALEAQARQGEAGAALRQQLAHTVAASRADLLARGLVTA